MPVPKLPLRLTGLLYPYHLAWWRNKVRREPILSDWNSDHRAIFVHIPKTAGTSVLKSLGAPPAFDTHAPSAIYRHVNPALYADAFKFTFVRNPWDRFASSFHFMKYGTEWKMQQDWARSTIGDLSFADFTRRLRNPLFRAKILSERFFWPQTFWLGGVGNVGDIDVFRFEELDDAIQAICGQLGIDPPAHTPHLRKSEKQDFREIYDPEMVQIVGDLYAADIKALGYKFSA